MALILKHWLVTLYPAEYAASGEITYSYACQAPSPSVAIEKACRSCEDINYWDAGQLDALTIKSEVKPDQAANAKELLLAATALDAAMNTAEEPPTGDDYNDLFSLVRAWLGQDESAAAPIIKLICNCCNASLWGRQWAGQRKGFGLCNACIEISSWGPTGAPPVEDYGHPNIHFNVRKDSAS